MEELNILFGTLVFQIVGILIVVDFILGTIAAIIKKEFVFRRLAKFMESVITYILGLVIFGLYGLAFSAFSFWILWAGFALIAIALLGSMIGNLAKMGLPLPKKLKKILK